MKLQLSEVLDSEVINNGILQRRYSDYSLFTCHPSSTINSLELKFDIIPLVVWHDGMLLMLFWVSIMNSDVTTSCEKLCTRLVQSYFISLVSQFVKQILWDWQPVGITELWLLGCHSADHRWLVNWIPGIIENASFARLQLCIWQRPYRASGAQSNTADSQAM